MARSKSDSGCVESKMKHASVIISDRAVSHREKYDSVVYYREINTDPVKSFAHANREK